MYVILFEHDYYYYYYYYISDLCMIFHVFFVNILGCSYNVHSFNMHVYFLHVTCGMFYTPVSRCHALFILHIAGMSVFRYFIANKS